MTTLISGILKKKKKRYTWTYFTKQKETPRLRKGIYGYQGEGIFREFGKVMYTLLYSKWITKNDLLYSTWNSTQCCMPAWMGGGFEGKWIHAYVWLSSLFTETTTTLLISYTPIQNKKFEKKNVLQSFPSNPTRLSVFTASLSYYLSLLMVLCLIAFSSTSIWTLRAGTLFP